MREHEELWGMRRAEQTAREFLMLSDMDLLTQTAKAARDILEVEQIDVVADKGYYKIEDIEACEKAGMTNKKPSLFRLKPKSLHNRTSVETY
jgi:hypothetical protein